MNRLVEDLANKYLRLDLQLIRQLGIIGVVLGGSMIYSHAEDHTLMCARDLDGALFVPHNADLAALLKERRSLLMNALRIDSEEDSTPRLPEDLSAELPRIDGIRFAGFSADGVKRSFKVLSLASFKEDRRVLNILSSKDKRVYEGFTVDGVPAIRLQRATKLGNHCVLLHDPWIFEGPASGSGDHQHQVSFGVTADLLVTGFWLADLSDCERTVSTLLLGAMIGRGTKSPAKLGFTRGPRFGGTYRAWLEKKLGSHGSSCLERGKYSLAKNIVFLTSVDTTKDAMIPAAEGMMRCLTDKECSTIARACEVSASATPLHSPFANNSSVEILDIELAATGCRTPDMKLRVIRKQCLNPSHQMAEVTGALQAGAHYPNVQIPTVRGPEMYYSYFDGSSESELQLRYHKQPTDEVLNRILDVEMRKAEDIVRAYRRSIRMPTSMDQSAGPWSIHRFFHERVLQMTRLMSLYADGISVGGVMVDLSSFLKTPMTINGRDFPCLAQIHNEAERQLNPQRFWEMPIAFGLGDAHGGNVLDAADAAAAPAMRLLYVDYEVGGVHSPVLDMAKPLFNDTLFGTLYGDVLPLNRNVEVTYRADKLAINLAPHIQKCACAVAKIKFDYLLEPVAALLQEFDCLPETWVPVLGYALFSCAILTRDFNHDWNTFFACLAIGVEFTRCTNLEELRQVFEGCLDTRL